MIVSLRPGEKIYINGAVLRADRKVSLELLNDVTFLLESHVMQPEQATTPLRQLYFVVQTLLMTPGDPAARDVFEEMRARLLESFANAGIRSGLAEIERQVAAKRPFDALKTIRGLLPVEERILAGAEDVSPPRAA
ncbi:flagellar biosynthesis repressor FlbT [Faunimonas sp. B44]|uniref:flagellar biosynthesis repressor FlbT n=1 Tax=Faunimonas sp. B44 TaxID=3461493 RepID=UPI004044B59B